MIQNKHNNTVLKDAQSDSNYLPITNSDRQADRQNQICDDVNPKICDKSKVQPCIGSESNLSDQIQMINLKSFIDWAKLP